MTITAGDITGPARKLLLDVAAVTWPASELHDYLNEGIRATCLIKPDVYTTQAPLTLITGIEQQLPSDSTGLVSIIRNTASKSTITQVDTELLVEANRFYPAGTTSVDVEHFTFDPRQPRRFLVYPPATNTSSVIAVYGITPAEIAADSDDFPLPEAYQAPLIDYVLARAYGKNSKKQDLTKETYHMQAWGKALGMKASAQVTLSPRVSQSPGE
jgi:hypothetical protein